MDSVGRIDVAIVSVPGNYGTGIVQFFSAELHRFAEFEVLLTAPSLYCCK
jgi:hypothetical protein